MAFLIPQNIPSRNDVPERLQTVARCLRDLLPEEVTVWLARTGESDRAAIEREFDERSAPDDGSEPYLLILDPSAGIVMLEAPSRIRLRKNRGRAARLDRDRIRKSTEARANDLRRSLDAGSISDLPVEVAVALVDVSSSDAALIRAEVPVLCAGDFTSERLRSALREVVGGARSPMGEAEESAARAAVNPEIVIRETPGRLFAPPEDRGDDEEILRTLDRRQERMARSLGPGYRLIRGVAGSGKTLVLTCRAQHIAENFPHWRILLLCFNKALSLALAQHIAKHRKVQVRTIDALARRVLIRAGRTLGDEEQPDFARRRRDAVEAVSSIDEPLLFDMVLVDEAQDLDESGLDLAWAMLKPGRAHFVMALDGAQMIYRRRMTWNPPGMTARGRTTILDVNYRNTREILDLGQRLLAGVDQPVLDSRPDDLDVLVRPDRALRTGRPPACLACADHRGEAKAIAERVQELRRNGVPLDQITVLLGTEDLRHDVMRLVPDSFDTKPYQNRDRLFEVAGRVRVSTLRQLKGLEFRHVIIGGANHISVHTDEGDSPAEDQRRLLYVGVTRATETLAITYSGEGIMSALERLPEFDKEGHGRPQPAGAATEPAT